MLNLPREIVLGENIVAGLRRGMDRVTTKSLDGLGTTDYLREGRMSVTAFSPKIAIFEHILTA